MTIPDPSYEDLRSWWQQAAQERDDLKAELDGLEAELADKNKVVSALRFVIAQCRYGAAAYRRDESFVRLLDTLRERCEDALPVVKEVEPDAVQAGDG